VIENVVLLDPENGKLGDLAGAFRKVLGNGCLVHTVATVDEMEASIRSGFPYHLAVVGVDPGSSSTTNGVVLKRLRAASAVLPIIAAAERGSVTVAARVVAAGATDLLVLGPNLQDRVTTLLGKVRQLVLLLERSQELESEASRLQQAERARYRIIGESPQVRELMDRIQRVAKVPRPVLIVGERGTGKELVARAIHEIAVGDEHPMVSVNCAAFSDTLLESELFGHEKGAFTGADREAHGKFELADGGTLFLDEIGCMSLPFQQKILRTVEYGVFIRVGGSKEIRTSARIVAATNADLREKMAAGEFLRDLYDRLAFEVIKVPALRKREGDIGLLAQHFLSQFMREIPSMRGKHLTRAALRALDRYSFPGNVRELKHIIERAAYRDTNNEIVPEELGLPAPSIRIDLTSGGFEDRVEAFKRSLILEALKHADGNQAQAARQLGLSYHQYRYFLRKYRDTD
jgi:DNA-binding NtrC family response regulator